MPTCLDKEVRLWKRKWEGVVDKPSTISQTLQKTNCDMFQNTHTILPMLLVVPVSNATVERGNSAIKVIKTKIRSTIGQERLNSLTLLYIHRDIPLHYTTIVDIFAKKNPRRIVSANPLK